MGICSENVAEASLSEVEICEASTIPPNRWVVATTPSATFWTSLREVESWRLVVRSTLRRAGESGWAGAGLTVSGLACRWMDVLPPPAAAGGAMDLAALSAGRAGAAEPADEADFVGESPPLATTTATMTAAASPAAGDQASHDRRRGGAERASSTRASSRAAKAGFICGRCARTSATSSLHGEGSPASARSSSSSSARTVGSVRMAGLSKLGDGTVQAGAGGGLADADDLRDLGI